MIFLRHHFLPLSIITAFTMLLARSPSASGSPLHELTAPREAVSDSSSILTPDVRNILQTLLLEHDRMTGEQIVLAVSADGNSEDELPALGHQAFEKWKLGRRFGKGQGVLLVIDAKSRKFALITGVGIDTEASNESWRALESEVSNPLSLGRIDRAAVVAVLATLNAVESPLIVSGKAGELLAAISIADARSPEAVITAEARWIQALLATLLAGAALIIAGWVVQRIAQADVHFEASGWRRIQPFRLNFRKHTLRLPSGAPGAW